MQRGIPAHVAQGMVANMIAESGLNPGINEISPTVQGSRGGYGLNQWTGPRRVQFEQFAAARGVSPSDLNAQLDFTVWELQNSEKNAGNALLSAPDAMSAAQIYSDKFLRPGIPHNDVRLANAARLSGGAAPTQGQNALGQPNQQQATQNALSQPVWKATLMDPNAFANRNPFTAIPYTTG